MVNASVDFVLNDEETLNAEFEVTPDVTYEAVIDLSSATRKHDELSNRDLPDQHPISAITNLEETLYGYGHNIDGLLDTVAGYGDIVTHDADEFATAEQGALADTALQPGDNVSELVNDVGYLRASSLNGYATEGYVNAEISNITDILDSYGNIVTHNVNEFATAAQGAKADTALQPNDNISELTNDVGYVTSAAIPTNYVTTNTTQTITGEKNFTGIVSIPAGKTYITAGNGGAKLGYFTYDIDGYSNITLQTMTASNRDINFKTNNSGKVKYKGKEIAIKEDVKDGKLALQRNGVNVGEFTANQSTDTTINITIPTQASDVNALPDTTTISDLTTTAQLNALNSGATTTNIGQITTNENDISNINDKIPSQASSSNQLADKSFVNSSIATNTANFIGTFNSVAELEAYSGTLTNNDYAFVQTTDTAGNTLYDRYKWNGSEWLFEYELNNSSFTAAQWATINSGATSSDVALAQSALQPNDNVSELVNDAGYITSASLPTVNNGGLTIQRNGVDVQTFTANQSTNATANITVPTKTSDIANDSGYITGITSSDVTTALGYTPYNSSNPSGYITGITSGDVTTALGYTPYNSSNPSGYISGITSGDVTSALGYTPADDSDVSAIQTNYVTTNTVQTISESKTFTKEIFATLASYSATNGASNANPYKKIGECVLTGAYQVVNVPFIYSRTNHSTSSDSYLGKIVLRVDGTAGTLGQNNTGIIISEVPDFIDNGDIGLYVVYKDNTPESNKVTCQIWVYVKNTYQGVNIMPLRQGTGSDTYSTTNITWGNNLVEASELPSDYASIIQRKAVIYNVTQSSTDNSRKVATTAYVKNNLADYVTTNTAQTISGSKTFSSDITIQKSTPSIKYRNNDMERGVNPQSNLNKYIAEWRDKNNTVLGYITTRYETSGRWGIGFQVTEGTTWQSLEISIDSNKNVSTSCPTPTQDTTSSTQIDTVGARNTKLGSMFQVVSALPATPDANTFYFIEES